MKARHLLLGRPWQFDKYTTNIVRTNNYPFAHKDHKFTLAPLSPSEVHEIQKHMNKGEEIKNSNLYMRSHKNRKTLSAKSTMLLIIFKRNSKLRINR